MPSSSELSILTIVNILQLAIPFLLGVTLSAKHFGQQRVSAILVLTASVLILVEIAYGAVRPVLLLFSLASIAGVFIHNGIQSLLDTLTVLLLMSAIFVERGHSRIMPATNTDRDPVAPQKSAHRGALILTLGLVALLIPPLGILAWILGARDLRAMRQGHMDTAGREHTLAGMILGAIIGLVFVLSLIAAAPFLFDVSDAVMLGVPFGLQMLVNLVVGVTLSILLLRRSRKAALYLFIASALVLLPVAYGFILSFLARSHALISDITLINGIIRAILTLALFLFLIGAAFSGRQPLALNRSQDTPSQPAHKHGSPVLALGLVSLLVIQPLGIIAWVLGVQDLRAMREGRMNPDGHTATLVGTVLGIIAVILILLALTIVAFTVANFFDHHRPFH